MMTIDTLSIKKLGYKMGENPDPKYKKYRTVMKTHSVQNKNSVQNIDVDKTCIRIKCFLSGLNDTYRV